MLTVDSATPASGATITATPADNNNKTSGVTPFTLSYNAGAAVTLTAPATAGGYNFSAWTGCATANTTTCNVTMNANTTVTATYSGPSITSVTVAPNPTTAIIGTQVPFSATVTGTGNSAAP